MTHGALARTAVGKPPWATRFGKQRAAEMSCSEPAAAAAEGGVQLALGALIEYRYRSGGPFRVSQCTLSHVGTRFYLRSSVQKKQRGWVALRRCECACYVAWG